MHLHLWPCELFHTFGCYSWRKSQLFLLKRQALNFIKNKSPWLVSHKTWRIRLPALLLRKPLPYSGREFRCGFIRHWLLIWINTPLMSMKGWSIWDVGIRKNLARHGFWVLCIWSSCLLLASISKWWSWRLCVNIKEECITCSNITQWIVKTNWYISGPLSHCFNEYLLYFR